MTTDQIAAVKTATHKAVLTSRHLGRRFFAIITDKPEYDFSATKVAAMTVVFMVCHVAEESHSFTWTMVSLVVASFATLFGKSTFGFFLAKWSQEKDKG